MPKTIYDYPDIYTRIGMELGNFGCIMLDVEQIPVSDIIDEVGKDFFYFSTNPLLRYVKGPVAETQAHATLLYGLTPNDNAGIDQKASVDELLSDLDLSSVRVSDVDHFPPQFGEPYNCVVAKLNIDNDLGEANRRLRFLPHIDSFIEFKPHVTLAYVKTENTDEAESALGAALEDVTLKAIGLNYGGPIS